MHPAVPRYVNGHCRLRKLASFPTESRDIHCIQLSRDGALLAIGNDAGRLEIRKRSDGGKAWIPISVCFTGAPIRALLWHPTRLSTVFVGSANGSLHQIQIVIGGANIVNHGDVADYIHALAMSPDGDELIIAYGQQLSMVRNPFAQKDHIGLLLDIPITRWMQGEGAIDSSRLARYTVVRAIYFVDESTLAVTFFGRSPIGLFSRSSLSLVAEIQLRPGSLLGSSAISPTGERLAVMNLKDQVDWYSVSHGKYITTTEYIPSRRPLVNLVVDLCFIDDDTVAVGHVDGSVYLASFGYPYIFSSLIMALATEPVQTVTVGFCEGKPHIFAVLPRHSRGTQPPPSTSSVAIGIIETPQRNGARSHSVAKLIHRFKPTFLSPAPFFVIIASTCFAILINTCFLFPSAPKSSPLLIPPYASSCGVETSTIRLFRTTTLTERPSGTCICTLTGSMQSQPHAPTVTFRKNPPT